MTILVEMLIFAFYCFIYAVMHFTFIKKLKLMWLE